MNFAAKWDRQSVGGLVVFATASSYLHIMPIFVYLLVVDKGIETVESGVVASMRTFGEIVVLVVAAFWSAIRGRIVALIAAISIVFASLFLSVAHFGTGLVLFTVIGIGCGILKAYGISLTAGRVDPEMNARWRMIGTMATSGILTLLLARFGEIVGYSDVHILIALAFSCLLLIGLTLSRNSCTLETFKIKKNSPEIFRESIIYLIILSGLIIVGTGIITYALIFLKSPNLTFINLMIALALSKVAAALSLYTFNILKEYDRIFNLIYAALFIGSTGGLLFWASELTLMGTVCVLSAFEIAINSQAAALQGAVERYSHIVANRWMVPVMVMSAVVGPILIGTIIGNNMSWTLFLIAALFTLISAAALSPMSRHIFTVVQQFK